MSLFVLMQILPVLEVTPTERQLSKVQALLETDECQTYLEAAEVCSQIQAHFVVHVRGVDWYNNFRVTCLEMLWLSICVLAGSTVF